MYLIQGIRFGSWKVRRLNWALRSFLKFSDKVDKEWRQMQAEQIKNECYGSHFDWYRSFEKLYVIYFLRKF